MIRKREKKCEQNKIGRATFTVSHPNYILSFYSLLNFATMVSAKALI